MTGMLKSLIHKTGLARYSQTAERVNWKLRYMRDVENQSGLSVFPNREQMYAFLSERFHDSGSAPIDYLEFGVYQGKSIAKWSELNQNAASRFFGFDSFEGLPEDWTKLRPKGSFATGLVPAMEDQRVKFVVGWFQASLPGFLKDFQSGNQMVIHIDCDLYSSTLYVLTQMDQWMPKGALVIFDELYYAEHEYRALLDYVSAYRRKFELIAAATGYGQVAIRLL